MNYRALVSVLLASILLVITACEPTEKAQEVPSGQAEAAPEPTADPLLSAETAAAAEESATEFSETEGTSNDARPGDEIILAAAPKPATAATNWKFSEGKHFRRMTTSQGTSSAPDKIEVAEVFWYGCPHCYDFDPILEQWQTTLPADVSFVRIPVIWNPTNQIHARIMYTAEALGILEEVNGDIFEAIHQKGNMLTTDDQIVAFFREHGVEEAKFREAFGSFGVTSAVKRAENLTRRYGIRSVPVIVVNGKYATDAPEIRGFGDIIDVTNELVERERQEL